MVELKNLRSGNVIHLGRNNYEFQGFTIRSGQAHAKLVQLPIKGNKPKTHWVSAGLLEENATFRRSVR